jgi:hypothetical protein
MFYARYNDRAAGADAGTPRDRNDTAAPQAEVLVTSFEETTPETGTSGSWVIRIRYPPYRETSAIDAAVIGGNLYLSFFIRDGGTSAEDLRGFWRGAGTASGVTLSRPWFADSMESLYITGEAVFRIRYWPLASDAAPDMGAEARFSDGASEYRVSKYIRSGDRIFTCVQGRGARIRQVTKSPLPPEGVTLSENGKLCTFSKPYLTGANHVVDKVSSGMVE